MVKQDVNGSIVLKNILFYCLLFNTVSTVREQQFTTVTESLSERRKILTEIKAYESATSQLIVVLVKSFN